MLYGYEERLAKRSPIKEPLAKEIDKYQLFISAMKELPASQQLQLERFLDFLTETYVKEKGEGVE